MKCIDGVGFAAFNTSKTWDEAQASCGTTGGNLATLESQTQLKRVVTVSSGCGSVWIGYRRSGGHFSWAHGSNSVWVNWKGGHPKSEKDCSAINNNNKVTTAMLSDKFGCLRFLLGFLVPVLGVISGRWRVVGGSCCGCVRKVGSRAGSMVLGVVVGLCCSGVGLLCSFGGRGAGVVCIVIVVLFFTFTTKKRRQHPNFYERTRPWRWSLRLVRLKNVMRAVTRPPRRPRQPSQRHWHASMPVRAAGCLSAPKFGETRLSR